MRDSFLTRNANILLCLLLTTILSILFVGIVLLSFYDAISNPRKPTIAVTHHESKYLSNVHQITHEGVNAEAYWSQDGSLFSFQAIRKGYSQCDQIFRMTANGEQVKMISNGKGRTTCSYFLPGNRHFVYSSTMDSLGAGCPPSPDPSAGYVWPVYKTMDIYKADAETGEIVQRLTDTDGYDAEATVAPNGQSMVFTSVRDGDLDLYSMDLNGTNVKRLTFSPGYDGGAFYSRDSKKIVWRANRPKGQKLLEYMELLRLGLVEPVATDMEIYVMDADGSNQRRITKIGGANFAPSFLPDDSGIIFASNMNKGNVFHLYTIGLDGKNLTQITTEGTFNLFPLFSPDGKYLAWSSNRNTTQPRDMNVIIAEWKGL